ncbi:LPXTG cell wall anchor domain-containing protein [Lactiplantibacillus dongliensis]|uniref:LPXTG cell wall anchor domain-containing protein n=1 Tax=Lactiplantibacillus dongliensis TaxID=2559919 RepID=A0ABW1R3A5_9LACO|nr:LPXTG cell wall anchor domain-containing protein [Lactiplantibacillus dongliensis]
MHKKTMVMILGAGALFAWGCWLNSTVQAANRTDSQATVRFYRSKTSATTTTHAGDQLHVKATSKSTQTTKKSRVISKVIAPTNSTTTTQPAGITGWLPQTSEQWTMWLVGLGVMILILLINFKLRKRGTQS